MVQAVGTGAKDLIRHVLGEVDAYLVTWTRVPGAPGEGTDQRYWKYPERLEEAVAYLHAESGRGRDAYFAVSPFKEGGNRRGENVTDTVPTLRLDFDGYKGSAPEGLPDPTAYVVSSPGSYHMYFRLSRPVPKEQAAELSRRLARWSGMDTSPASNTAVLRVPGTKNYKPEHGGHVVTAEITGVEFYDPDEFEALLPPEPTRTAPQDEYDGPPGVALVLEDWLEEHPEAEGAIVDERYDEKARVKFAVVCPWVKEHSGGDDSGTYLGQYPEGALFFRCNHGHCEERGWREYRRFHADKRERPRVVFGDGFESESGEETSDRKPACASSATVPLGVGADPLPTASVPAFPVDALPPTLRRLALEAAHAKETPVDFVATPMLPALGVAIGSSRAIELTRTYRENAIVWTAVVAPPASGKSPAEDVAMEPVEHQRKVYAHEHRLALEKWKEEHQTWELAASEARKKKKRIPPEPEKPTKKRIRVGDTTLEALLLRLTENPRGLILGRDELAGFVNSLGQYKGGKGADREAWLSLHSGKTPPLDRKSADESYDIFYPHVSVVGSIQPSKLKVFDISAGDGLIERFLVSYPEAEISPEAEEDISLAAEEGYRRVWDRLHAFEPTKDGFGQPAPKGVPLTPGAREAWKGYRNALKQEAFRPGTPEYVQGVIGKLRGYLARFSLILALVRTAEDGEATEEVRRVDVERAWALVIYFLAHARRVYDDLRDEAKDGGREIRLASALGEFLEERGGEWEGPATDLFEELKEAGHAGALPKTPDSLTEAVMKVARKTPALRAEKKRSGGKRRIRVSLSSGADPGVGVVAHRHSGTPGGDGADPGGSGTSAHSGTYSDEPGEGTAD